MNEHLLKFNTHSEYEQKESGLSLPNVSCCLDDNTTHFNEAPYDYEVEYLRNDGEAHIDTGIKMHKHWGMGCKFAVQSTGGWKIFCGSRTTFMYSLNWNESNGKVTILYDYLSGGGLAGISNYPKGQVLTIESVPDLENMKMNSYVNGEYRAQATLPNADAVQTVNCWCFSANNEYRNQVSDIYEFWITDTTGKRVIDLIPVVKDGVGCMYDKVSHKFFYKSGTGSFVLGPRKREPLFDAEIEYLQPSSSGANGAYINTEIKPTDLTGVEIMVKCPPDGTNNSKETIFFGASDDTLYKNGNNFTIEKAGGGNIGAFMFKTSSTGTSTIHSGHYSNPYILRVNCSSDGTKKGIMYDENRTQLNNVTLTRSANLPTSLDLYLFCRNINGSPDRSYNYITRIYYLKIWQDKTLVRDMVPVRKGNVGYMYDKVTNRLFGNLSTDDFVLGPDKPFDYKTIYYGII